MTEQDRIEALRYLISNFEIWSAHCAKIQAKNGQTLPFVWNRAQRHVHECIERQKAEKGYVKALVLKGRQQGISTYIGARFYHQTSTTHGRNAFIVAHEDKATSNLFKMVKRYHGHNPIAPSTRASNAQELIFGELDSGYRLATAGSKDVGRSATAQVFHGSEFAFWDNAQSHLAGIGNTIGSGAAATGTEMILESTANGLGNAFHLMWQAAVAGESEWQAIFVPWYWQDEYRAPVRDTLVLDEEDLKYQAAYKLTLEQMQFRANKIAEYGPGFEWLFDQEYPAAAELAFRSPTGKPLIGPTTVSAAVNSKHKDMAGQPLIIGVDPAGDGEDPSENRDRTAIAYRRGRVCYRIEYHRDLSTMQIAGMLAGYIREMRPDAVFIDKGGLGAGIVDRLHELNFEQVHGVMFGQRAHNSELYVNKRAEMWWDMKAWLEDQPVRIPNDAQLIGDLSAPQPIWRSDSKKQLESKKEMAKRQIRSPDGADALALTFAEPVEIRTDHDASFTSTSGPATKAGY